MQVQSPSAFRFEELIHHIEQVLRDRDVAPFRLGSDGNVHGLPLLLCHDPVTKHRAHRMRSSNSDACTKRPTQREPSFQFYHGPIEAGTAGVYPSRSSFFQFYHRSIETRV